MLVSLLGRSSIPLLLILLLTLLLVGPGAYGQNWPQFRGPNRDGSFPGRETIPQFPGDGPEVLWERMVGAGFSGLAVAEGRVVVFHRQGGREVVEAMVAESGETVWKFGYETAYRDDFGFDNGPRATPGDCRGQGVHVRGSGRSALP